MLRYSSPLWYSGFKETMIFPPLIEISYCGEPSWLKCGVHDLIPPGLWACSTFFPLFKVSATQRNKQFSCSHIILSFTAALPCKAKRQYLLTLQVSRYCLLALQSRAGVLHLYAYCRLVWWAMVYINLWQLNKVSLQLHNHFTEVRFCPSIETKIRPADKMSDTSRRQRVDRCGHLKRHAQYCRRLTEIMAAGNDAICACWRAMLIRFPKGTTEYMN